MPSQYAEDIRAERQKHKLSQKQVARRVGLYRTTVIDIERGDPVELTLDSFQKIIAAIQKDDAQEAIP